MSEQRDSEARGDDPLTCSKCGGPTKENGRWHPDLGTIYGYELGLGDATCGKRIAPERKAHKVHPSGKTLIWAGPGPAPETEGESRGETVAAYREALQEIATRPTVERNPDGDDQATETMQLLARETLAAHGELRPAMPNMPEAESRVRKPAHTEQQGEEEARGEADDEAFMEAWGSLKTYTLHAYSERYSPSIRHDGPNVRTYDADAVDALLVRLRPAFQEASDTPEVVERPETCPTCGSDDPRIRYEECDDGSWEPPGPFANVNPCPDPFHTPEDTSRVEEDEPIDLTTPVRTRARLAAWREVEGDIAGYDAEGYGRMIDHWPVVDDPERLGEVDEGESRVETTSGIDAGPWQEHEGTRVAQAVIAEIDKAYARGYNDGVQAEEQPQPVASEEDRTRVGAIVEDQALLTLDDADTLTRVLTDSETLAQYAKERGE